MALDRHREKQKSLCQMALRVDPIADTTDPSTDCSPNCFCLSSILIFAGSIVLCILGFTVVLPYEATSDWPEVTCRVVGVEYNRSICACRNQPNSYENCHGKSPCLRVTVAFRSAHKFTGSCSNVADGTSVTSLNSFGLNDSIVSTSGFSEFPEGAFQRSLAVEEGESPTSEDVHTSSPDVTGLDLLLSSLIIERRRPTTDLTKAPTPSHLRQSSVARRMSESLINKTVIVHQDLEMQLYSPYYTPARTNSTFVEARLFRSWYEAFYGECSVQECGEEFVNVKESTKFHRRWASKDKTHPCYYNPRNPCIAVVELASYWLAVHALVWPSLAIGIGMAFWATICFGGWSRRQSSASRLPEVVTYAR